MERKEEVDVKVIVDKDDVNPPEIHNYKQTELLSTYCDRRK